MSNDLKISLLGTPQIMLHGEPITGRLRGKAQALLFFLAVTQRPHNREVLSSLLWPEASSAQASKNLRNRLSELRKLLGDYLTITRQTVAFNLTSNHWLDTALFPENPKHGNPTVVAEHELVLTQEDLTRYQEAIQCYRGAFLEGFHVREAVTFDEWVTVQREQFRERMLTMLWMLATHYHDRADYGEGLRFCTRLLEVDLLNEDAHRLKMIMLAESGQRNAAFAQYETCCQILMDEFGVAPTAETQRVYEQIRSGALDTTHPPRQDRDFANTQVTSSSPNQEQPHQYEATTPDQELSSGLEAPQRLFDLIEMPEVEAFYGRKAELSQLDAWIVQEESRLVTILGIGGQGKTALAAYFVDEMTRGPEEERTGGREDWRTGGADATVFQSSSPPVFPASFSRIIWRSVLNAPPLSTILHDWLKFLSAQDVTELPEILDEQLRLLLELLNQQPCLLILDNLESIMQATVSDERPAVGYYRDGYEEYGQLFKRVATSQHQSCWLLTSREKPKEISLLETGSQAVHSLQLEGLPADAGQAMLQGHGVQDGEDVIDQLVQRYSGNPLALKLVAATIDELYFGDTESLLAEETLIFGDIQDVLEQHFARLSPLEEELLIWLAVEREPASAEILWSNLVQPPVRRTFLEALRSLQQRSLLEMRKTPGPRSGQNQAASTRFALQNVVMEYTTDTFVAQMCRAIQHGELAQVQRHALLKAQSYEYVRDSQRRLILRPVAEQFVNQSGKENADLKLAQLLNQTRAAGLRAPGYAGANVLHLWQQMGVDLRGRNFSHCCLWQADLQNIHLPEVNLSHANLTNTIYTERIGAMFRVTFSPDSKFVITSTYDGMIHMWHAEDGQSYAVWQADRMACHAVAISPDGQMLANGTNGHLVQVWDISAVAETGRGRLLYTLQAHSDVIIDVAFSPDGQLLASGGDDYTICLWDLARGELLTTLKGHTGIVESLAFRPLRNGHQQMLASGSLDGSIRLWICCGADTFEQQRLSNKSASAVTSVDFSPNGDHLVSAHEDNNIHIWDVQTGTCQQVLRGHTSKVPSVSFSLDGKSIASGGANATIRIWDVASGQCRQTMTGHTNFIGGIAYSPDGSMLASASQDNTIRLWNPHSGQCRQTLRGYPNKIYSASFSPDGSMIASGGDDAVLRLWRVNDDADHEPIPINLVGHVGTINCVAFSPDGSLLASGSADKTVRLWETETILSTGRPRYVLEGHPTSVQSVIFSPDSHFVVSVSSSIGIYVWHVSTGQLCQRLTHDRVIHAVFSPTNLSLFSAGYDGDICIWDIETGQCLQQFQLEGGGIREIAMNKNGNRIAAACLDGQIRILNADTGEVDQVLGKHAGQVYAIAYNFTFW
ncbi:pentapeptide repeat-containing protein [Chloroflexi bacterium TSY]|nr:pentapeptide repeat-containing protein [Chloroflexi bacterium TSY]